MSPRETIGILLIWTGVLFFSTTALAILRFPDTLCRLHALAKADNPGLGCVVAGLALLQPDPLVAGKLVMVWAIALFASATSAFGLARRIRRGSLPGHGKPGP
jgi:multicomponent Na+:H+ antiporter subunit G